MELTADIQSSLDEAQAKTRELESHQKEVDQLITDLEKLAKTDPSVAPLAADLAQKKADSRGWFEQYVLPAWKSIQEYLGMDASMSGLPAEYQAYQAMGRLKRESQDPEILTKLRAAGYAVTERKAMGFVPILIAGAGAAAVIAASYAYVQVANASIEREKTILNDPSLTPEVKAKLLQMKGGLSAVFSDAKGLAITLGLMTIGGLLVFRFARPRKKV